MPAAFGAECVIESELQERIFVDVRRDVDTAAIAAVAAARAAPRDEFLSAEGDATMSAVPGLNCDFGFVDEHDGPQRHRERQLDPDWKS
jgi:hypothetical protein